MEHKHNHSEGLENCLVCENDRLTKENADLVREQAIIDAATHPMGLSLKDKEEDIEALKADLAEAESSVLRLVKLNDKLTSEVKVYDNNFCVMEQLFIESQEEVEALKAENAILHSTKEINDGLYEALKAEREALNYLIDKQLPAKHLRAGEHRHFMRLLNQTEAT